MSRGGVLLLGGAGFIGSAISARLRRDGTSVHIAGRHEGAGIEQLLPQCDAVIHLASSTTPASSAAHFSLELPNLELTTRLLRLLQGRPQTHLIFFSSGGTIYGDPDQLPVREDAPTAPLSNYGAGKAAQENLCHALRLQNHAVTIVRPSNVYGPGQLMRNSFGLVRTMLEHVRQGTTFEIWGDGENIRDFIYIDDIVEASVRLLKLPKDSHTYNVSSGTGHSINQVRKIVETVCGRELKTIHRPSRGIDVRRVVLDSTYLNTRLEWEPSVGLEDGVTRTWDWLRKT